MKMPQALGATQVQKDKFRLDVKFLSDTTGVYLSYIPEPAVKDKKIIQLLGADRLDNQNKVGADGYFDYVEGYTVLSQSGRVFFPVVEPFGKGLAQALGSEELAKKYAFQELYDSTRTVARQVAEKNKFMLTGEYKASRNDEIQLGTMNIPRGSVVVTAGGQTLVEGVDYTAVWTAATKTHPTISPNVRTATATTSTNCSASPATWWAPPTAGIPANSPNSTTA